jgi:hypothetical protein
MAKATRAPGQNPTLFSTAKKIPLLETQGIISLIHLRQQGPRSRFPNEGPKFSHRTAAHLGALHFLLRDFFSSV